MYELKDLNFMFTTRINYCARCVTPSSRPRVAFDDLGICNACYHSEQKPDINWDERKTEFLKILDQNRSDSASWDCVVPWSGGKDSSSIAWKLKFEYGMNPLLVTFSPMLRTEVGDHNREEILKAGFDNIFFRPNQNIHRKLARRFFIERGNPKVAWDAGVNTLPVKVAIANDIKLIFYAEHGETEYGGKVLNEESQRIRDFTEVIEHQIGDDPSNWISDEIRESDLLPYIYPSTDTIRNSGVKALYFSYFHRWSMFDNYKFIKEKIDFHENPQGRTCGTFTKFDSLDDKFDDLYYYMQYIKFGFGRCIRDCSRFIQNQHMTRADALSICHRYDGEFPDFFLGEVLDYLNLTQDTFTKIVDQHRNPEIWDLKGDRWSLRYPLH